LLNRYKAVAGKEIALGFPAGKAQAYPDGESVAQVAYDNINGIGCIARDFMSYADPGIKAVTSPILKEIGRQVNKNSDAVTSLQEACGQAGAQAIKDAILEGEYSPNSENPMSAEMREMISASWGVSIPEGMSYAEAKRTIRGSDKPLVDTGYLVQSVTYVVRDKTS
jgi:hypothetical protein